MCLWCLQGTSRASDVDVTVFQFICQRCLSCAPEVAGGRDGFEIEANAHAFSGIHFSLLTASSLSSQKSQQLSLQTHTYNDPATTTTITMGKEDATQESIIPGTPHSCAFTTGVPSSTHLELCSLVSHLPPTKAIRSRGRKEQEKRNHITSQGFVE